MKNNNLYNLLEEEENYNIPTRVRKYHYWRGFKVALLVIVLPMLLAFVAFCHYIINALEVM